MKTKIVALIICIFSIATALTFVGCFELSPPAPTEEHIINMAKGWGVPFPEDVTVVNYALNAGIQDGEWLYIVEYSGKDENFINYLSDEEENTIAEVFKNSCIKLKEKFNEPYEMPDLSKGYYWLYEGKGSDTLIDDRFYLIYIPSANQILIYRLKI